MHFFLLCARPSLFDDILNFTYFQITTFSRDKAPVVQTLAYAPITAVIDSEGDLYLLLCIIPITCAGTCCTMRDM